MALSESTWGVPVVGALHVLGIACFGGAVLVRSLRMAAFRATGLGLLLSTGVLLFWAQPVRCYESFWFRIKMVLLLMVGVHTTLRRVRPQGRFAGYVSLMLWAGIIAAARGIAFF